MTAIGFLVEWALRSAVLILSGALLLRASRVKDPSIRLAVWTAILSGSLAIPLLAATLPGVPFTTSMTGSLEMPFSVQDGPATEGHQADASKAERGSGIFERVNWARAALLIYVVGALALLLRLGTGLAISMRLLRRSRSTDRAMEGIEVRESEDITAPVTLGIRHPAVVLPRDWRQWDAVKLTAVLAHEGSHVRRRDPAVQIVSAIHRALLWHDPLSWFLHRRIVQTAEEASDDAAIAAMPDRVAYAEMLLGFMQRGVRRAGLPGVPMARYGRQEDRIQRILDGTMCSRGITRWSVIAILALGTPLAYVAAAAYPQSASAQAAVTQKVKIQKIDIEGNHVLTTAQIKRAMKLIKEGKSSSVPAGKDDTDLKLQDDITRIRILYGEHGYIRASVSDPIVEVKKVEAGRTVENRYFITIKIEENDQYRIGDVNVTGSKQFTADQIRRVLNLVPGQVFNETMLRKNFDTLKKMYASRGFIYFAPIPVLDPDETKRVVNLTINIEEDGRSFSGGSRRGL
jgi:beta-lactamase regulating signal transducer with metallopeptidase domain